MGLDNHIIVKYDKKIKSPFWKKMETWPFCGEKVIELCYWRKCWGLRNSIINHLLEEGEEEDKQGIYPLDASDVENIRRVVTYFLHRRRWNREGNSIWLWEEIRFTLIQHYFRLAWLERQMKKNGLEAWFLDSY